MSILNLPYQRAASWFVSCLLVPALPLDWVFYAARWACLWTRVGGARQYPWLEELVEKARDLVDVAYPTLSGQEVCELDEYRAFQSGHQLVRYLVAYLFDSVFLVVSPSLLNGFTSQDWLMRLTSMMGLKR